MHAEKLGLFGAGMVTGACAACFLVGGTFLWRRRDRRSTAFYAVFCGVVIFTFATMVANLIATLDIAGRAGMSELWLAARFLQVFGVAVTIYSASHGQPGGFRSFMGVLVFSLIGGLGALLL